MGWFWRCKWLQMAEEGKGAANPVQGWIRGSSVDNNKL
jgi:hypothetical protein